MKKTKSVLKLLFLVGVLTVSILLLSGCYIVNSGRMKQIEGTYILTSYSDQKDMIEAREMTLYMVISSDGNGYYAYEDKDTALYFAPLQVRFIADTEESGKYSYVEVNFDGGEWISFGVNADFANSSLNYSRAKTMGTVFQDDFGIYYETASFNKVDGAKDLSYIKEELGDASLLPYGASRVSGFYEYTETNFTGTDYIVGEFSDDIAYLFIDLDFATAKGRAWYMLKSELEEKSATFDIGVAANGNGYTVMGITEGESAVYTEYGTSWYMEIEVDRTVDGESCGTKAKFAFRGDHTDTSIEYYLSEAASRYLPESSEELEAQ